MPAPVRRPLLRRLSAAVLLCLLIALPLAAHLLHWDDQLRLYWQERSTGAEQRAAGIWLPDYRLALERELPGLAGDETSGLTWNAPTGTLFTVTGQHPQLVELATDGRILRRIRLDGVADPEAVESLGDGRLAIVDERRRLLTVFPLPATDEPLDLAAWPQYDLGFAEAGNKGFEGLAWEPRRQRLLLAKERDPLGLFELPLPSGPSAAVSLAALPSAFLPMRDLSSLAIDPRSGHLLLLSDESRLLLELDLDGQPRSFIALRGGRYGLSTSIEQAEGVAMDDAGNIYLVGEPNRFYVFRKTAGTEPH